MLGYVILKQTGDDKYYSPWICAVSVCCPASRTGRGASR